MAIFDHSNRCKSVLGSRLQTCQFVHGDLAWAQRALRRFVGGQRSITELITRNRTFQRRAIMRVSNELVEGNRVALVVFLRGVNVGGHRTFRPTKLAEALNHLGAVNIGAAGTLVIRQPMTQAQARAAVARKLPFVADIIVCPGRDIASLISKNPFEGQSVR